MKIQTLILTSLLLSAPIFAQSHSHGPVSTTKAPAAVHGMVVYAGEKLYASHIPMFMVPHDWQMHMEIEFQHPELSFEELKEKIVSDKQQLFTIVPKPFVLPNLISGKINTFQADLYTGNFEQGGEVIVSNLTVKVMKILDSAQLKTSTPKAKTLTYKKVGDGFLAHKIVAPESFDQLLQVKWLKPEVSSEVELKLPFSDSLENKIAVGQYFKIDATGTLEAVEKLENADLEVISEFFCAIGPDFFESCPAPMVLNKAVK